jgi:transcriptional regulator with XRE-family HTH domain
VLRVRDPETVTALLAEVGLTQADLARAVLMSKAYMSMVCRGIGRVDDDDAAAIAAELRTSVGVIFEPSLRPTRRARLNGRAS